MSLHAVLSWATSCAFINKMSHRENLASGRKDPCEANRDEMIRRPPSLMCMVTAHVSVLSKPPAALSAELHYDMTDPYAVRLIMGPPVVRAVEWV